MSSFAKCQLLGYGRTDWATVRQAATGLTCAWADYDGFHVGTCPATAPPYSHLWAWRADGSMLLRARIDPPDSVLGLLLGRGRPAPALSIVPTIVEQVLTATRIITTWDADDGRVGGQLAEVLPGRIRTVEVLNPMPVVFVAGPVEQTTARGPLGDADA